MADVIMSWGECQIEIGKTGANDAMAVTLSSIGTIKEKTVNLEMADGEKLQAYASGHKLVAQEEQDGDITLSARIIEPDFAFLAGLLDADHDDVNDELTVRSLIVSDPYSVKVTPKNVGATGIKIRKSSVKLRKGISEEEGNFADITFTVLECADKELYTYFKKPVV